VVGEKSMKDIQGKDRLPLIISSTNLVMGEPIYSLAYDNAKKATEETDPYRRLSLLLTSLARFAYATQLHLVRKGESFLDYLPKYPVEITIKEGSLQLKASPFKAGMKDF